MFVLGTNNFIHLLKRCGWLVGARAAKFNPNYPNYPNCPDYPIYPNSLGGSATIFDFPRKTHNSFIARSRLRLFLWVIHMKNVEALVHFVVHFSKKKKKKPSLSA